MSAETEQKQEKQTESPQEAFVRANLERIDDLKTRIKEHGKVKNFSGYMLKTALKMETDIHKILTELYIPKNYPIERYLQTYRVGTSLKKHVFGIVIHIEKNQFKLQGISDINGRGRFNGESAEEILRKHLVPGFKVNDTVFVQGTGDKTEAEAMKVTEIGDKQVIAELDSVQITEQHIVLKPSSPENSK